VITAVYVFDGSNLKPKEPIDAECVPEMWGLLCALQGNTSVFGNQRSTGGHRTVGTDRSLRRAQPGDEGDRTVPKKTLHRIVRKHWRQRYLPLVWSTTSGLPWFFSRLGDRQRWQPIVRQSPCDLRYGAI